MSEGRLISINQFKQYTKITPETVDQDIERGIIKTETNSKKKQSIRWYGLAKNLTTYKKAKAKWETESRFSASKEEEEPELKIKTKAVQVGDLVAVSKWAELADLKTPTLLTDAIAKDNLFEFVDIKIRGTSITGTERRHFKIEWIGPEKATIVVDVLYMKRTPLDWKKNFLAERLNAPKELEELEEVKADEELVEVTVEVQDTKMDLVETVAQLAFVGIQFFFGVKTRIKDLIREQEEADAEPETETNNLESEAAAN